MSETVSRFDGRAGDYARYRPTYPAGVIDEIFGGFGDPSHLTIVDAGAGTGISTALLRERGARTIGIEPNAEMREVAIANSLDVRDARAAALPFEDGTIDIVTAFQSFHWFAQHEVAVEFARVLRQARARIAIVWNERDDDDAFTRGYGEVVDGFAKRIALAEGQTAERSANALIASLFPEPAWRLRTACFTHSQRFDRASLDGRVRSTSYAPREGPAHEAMNAALDRLFATYRNDDATVLMRMLAEVYLLDRVAGNEAFASDLR